MDTAEILIAVGAVIENERGQILLVKHVPERGGFWQGKWICPGGGLHFGESIEEGIKREVREETELEVQLIDPLPPFERIVKEGDGCSLHVIYIDYRAKLIGGTFRPGDDVGEGIWIDKEDITAIRDELHEDTWKLLCIAEVVDDC